MNRCESSGCIETTADGDTVVVRSTITGESMRCTAVEWQAFLDGLGTASAQAVERYDARVAADKRVLDAADRWRADWDSFAGESSLEACEALLAAVDALRALTDEAEGDRG